MNHPRRRKSKPLVAAAVALSGATLLSGCDTILKEAFVDGTTSYLFTGFFPSLLPDETDAGDATQGDE